MRGLRERSRRASIREELWLLQAGWYWHGSCRAPCWHHPRLDLGREAFTTDGALRVSGCIEGRHGTESQVTISLTMVEIRAA
jgi:hypothetical protein